MSNYYRIGLLCGANEAVQDPKFQMSAKTTALVAAISIFGTAILVRKVIPTSRRNP